MEMMNSEIYKENVDAITNRQPFKLSQLKYTKYHWMSGEITNGCPITTSIEIKPDMFDNKWKLNMVHKYMLEDGFKEETINQQYELQNQDTILELLEKNDIRDLKNNYFSDDKIQGYSHWELEYNYYFKISGTYDNEPNQIKEIARLLNCENKINEALLKVENEI